MELNIQSNYYCKHFASSSYLCNKVLKLRGPFVWAAQRRRTLCCNIEHCLGKHMQKPQK